MKINILNIDGKKISDMELSDKIFSLKPSRDIIQSVLDTQLNKMKKRTAKTKQRGEIKGSTAKIYAQKGTGGARHSSRKAPIFVGGGVAHGPKGAVYKIKKINKKVRKMGLLHMLSEKNQLKTLFIIEDFKEKINKTKKFNEFLKKNKFENSLLIYDKESISKILKSARNIPNLKIIEPESTNVYDLLKYKNVIFTTSSVKKLQERLIK